MLVNNDINTVWYVKTESGQLVGPFASSFLAEQAKMIQEIKGTVVAGTANKQELLLG